MLERNRVRIIDEFQNSSLPSSSDLIGMYFQWCQGIIMALSISSSHAVDIYIVADEDGTQYAMKLHRYAQKLISGHWHLLEIYFKRIHLES